jgi:ketopantoate hydroxymethyltransferase
MIADSYLMTHLGRPSTRLESEAEQSWGLDLMVSLVAAAHEQRRQSFGLVNKPYLVGDFPDGASSSIERALIAADRMVEAGADVVKVEGASPETLEIIEHLVKAGVTVMAHIGYTPQKGINRRYGDTLLEALELINSARRVRDAGADALVLERISEPVNQILSAPNPKGLQIYSIFSGRSRAGGQSLNVWDSVFAPDFKSQFFPPTADLDRSAYPTEYTEERMASKLGELIQLTLDGTFPKSPASKLPADALNALRMINPWSRFNADALISETEPVVVG